MCQDSLQGDFTHTQEDRPHVRLGLHTSDVWGFYAWNKFGSAAGRDTEKLSIRHLSIFSRLDEFTRMSGWKPTRCVLETVMHGRNGGDVSPRAPAV